MLGSGFRLYFAYANTTTPYAIDSLVNADGSAATPNGGNEVTIKDLVDGQTGPPAIAANSLKIADEIKDVTEAGNPNTINTTTRRTGRQGVQASEITTVSRDLSIQLVYEPHTAFATPTPGYEILDLLEYCEETKSKVFVIDLDQALGTTGAKGAGANYTVALSQPREVEGQVVYDATLAVKDFYQRVQWDGTDWRAKVNP